MSFSEGNIVDLKRKHGKNLKKCEIICIYENGLGFVYYRPNCKGGSYSQVRLEDLEKLIIHKEG